MSKISSVSVLMRLCTTNRNENENDNENETIGLTILKMKVIMKNKYTKYTKQRISNIWG